GLSVAGNGDSGHGTAQTFSAAYKLALANTPLSKEAFTAADSPSPASGAKHIPLAGQQQRDGHYKEMMDLLKNLK
ncbi:MAG: hypothetical protein AB1649_00005, partial [Chloroflexota bacterium]